jgi:hypothetical protein
LTATLLPPLQFICVLGWGRLAVRIVSVNLHCFAETSQIRVGMTRSNSAMHDDEKNTEEYTDD